MWNGGFWGWEWLAGRLLSSCEVRNWGGSGGYREGRRASVGYRKEVWEGGCRKERRERRVGRNDEKEGREVWNERQEILVVAV